MADRNEAIDVFRAVAVFCVVIIHTEPFLHLTGAGHGIGFVLITVSRFAVPFFFLVSGYLFAVKITQSEAPNAYYRQYVGKLFKMYLAWQAVYLIYDAATFQVGGAHTYRQAMADVQAMGLTELVKRPIGMLYYGLYSSGYQLWYLTSLILSISIVYLFHKRGAIKLLAASSLLLHLAGIAGGSYLGLFPRDFMARDALFLGLFYTMLGYAFHRYREPIRSKLQGKAKPLLLILLLSLGTELAERTLIAAWFDTERGDYFLSTIVLSSALFLLLTLRPEIGRGSVLVKMGKQAAGIYLIHFLYINGTYLVLETNRLSGLRETWIWDILFTPCVIVLSYVSYTGLQAMKRSLGVIKKTRERSIA